jgi:hypothetical protein
MDDHGHNPSIHDSTHDDHERFERRQLARDSDSSPDPGHGTLVTVDESWAAQSVRALREEGVVDAIPDEQRLVHRPSEMVFRSDRALILFHHGWMVAAQNDQHGHDDQRGQ